MKNKIGWCSMTWNSVWGCRNHCEYCYARKMAGFRYNAMADKEYKYLYYKVENFCKGEFANRLRHFVPTFIQSQFEKKLPEKPQRIFIGSMSEIYYWKEEWIEMVIEKVKQHPQHTFQFLTKFPEVYQKYNFPKNCWLGVTVTKETDKDNENFKYFRTIHIVFLLDINTHNIDNKRFISFEPLLENINLDFLKSSSIDWVIIGAETGNRKGKVIPKKEWVEDMVGYCRYKNIPVYLKDSLKEIYPVEIKEFPNYK